MEHKKRSVGFARIVLPIGVALGVVAILAAAAGSTTALANLASSTGTLPLNGTLKVESLIAACPAGTPITTECYSREGAGTIVGLGRVTISYIYFVDSVPAGCPSGNYRALGSEVRMTSTKGDLMFTTTPMTECASTAIVAVTPATQAFTVTGGTGRYAGASGTGHVNRDMHLKETGPAGASGTETWEGRLFAPSQEFDTTPPTLSGATSKTVRIPRKTRSARVTFTVTSLDDLDGSAQATCKPKSGSLFKAGRTTVTCSATDTSGNTASVSFAISVIRKR